MKPERRKALKRCQNKKRFAKFDSRISFSFSFSKNLCHSCKFATKPFCLSFEINSCCPQSRFHKIQFCFSSKAANVKTFLIRSLAVRSLDQNSITQRAFISKAYNVAVLYVFLWKLQLFFKTYLIRWAYFAISVVCKVVARRNLKKLFVQGVESRDLYSIRVNFTCVLY